MNKGSYFMFYSIKYFSQFIGNFSTSATHWKLQNWGVQSFDKKVEKIFPTKLTERKNKIEAANVDILI